MWKITIVRLLFFIKIVTLFKAVLTNSKKRLLLFLIFREIKKEILLELGTKIISKKITLEKINQSIAKNLK